MLQYARILKEHVMEEAFISAGFTDLYSSIVTRIGLHFHLSLRDSSNLRRVQATSLSTRGL